MNRIITLIALFIVLNPVAYTQNTINLDSVLTHAMNVINIDSIEHQVQWLQDMDTRFMIAPNRKEVAESIKTRFESYGMSNVRLDSFECHTTISYGIIQYDTTTWQYNVEAKIIGSTYPNEEILVLGHHDDIQIDSNPEIFAPGADDNASGTVAVLETARVLMSMGYQPERTLVFLTTAAEELMHYGLAGSEHYAAEASLSGGNIVTVINNDMIAFDNGSNKVKFSNLSGSETITAIAAYIANNYTGLTPDIPALQYMTGADLQPFIDEGYPGLYLMEYVFNPGYHSENDLIDSCNMNYLTEVIKISLGVMIYSDLSLAVNDEQNSNLRIMVWPNPVENVLHLAPCNYNEPVFIQMVNAGGQSVYEVQIDDLKGAYDIDMTHMPSGVYFLQLVSGSVSGSVIVMKN